MWILILIISIIVNCIITLILISQIQKAVLNAVKIQDKHNEVFTRNISEIYREIKSKEAVNKEKSYEVKICTGSNGRSYENVRKHKLSRL